MNHQHLVVHCKHDKYDIYIGRASKSAPKGVPCHWGNPFAMKNQSDEERYRVCAAYEKWITTQPSLIAKAKRELKGKVLGCYCSPKPCHGHILARIANSDSDESDIGVQPVLKDSSTTTSTCKASTIPIKSVSHQSHQDVQLKSDDQAFHTKVSQELLPPTPPTSTQSYLVDIGINVHNKQMLKTWRKQVQRAYDAKVTTVILTGTSVKCSSNSLDLAEAYQREKPLNMDMSLYCTVGIHPHDAKSYQGPDTLLSLRSLLQHSLAIAVGECGLDYNRNFSTPIQQQVCFEEQIKLACELRKPLFVHEREAHVDVVNILSKYMNELPPVVIHCFTGTAEEAKTYIEMGFYIGFTGTICKYERGKPLRELLPLLPLHRIMLETDAPFMGFVKGRRESEPQDVVLVAQKVAEVLQIDVETVRNVTTNNVRTFFSLPTIKYTEHALKPSTVPSKKEEEESAQRVHNKRNGKQRREQHYTFT